MFSKQLNQSSKYSCKKNQNTKHVGLSWIFITSLCSDSRMNCSFFFYQDVLICKEGVKKVRMVIVSILGVCVGG